MRFSKLFDLKMGEVPSERLPNRIENINNMPLRLTASFYNSHCHNFGS